MNVENGNTRTIQGYEHNTLIDKSYRLAALHFKMIFVVILLCPHYLLCASSIETEIVCQFKNHIINTNNLETYANAGFAQFYYQYDWFTLIYLSICSNDGSTAHRRAARRKTDARAGRAARRPRVSLRTSRAADWSGRRARAACWTPAHPHRIHSPSPVRRWTTRGHES